MATIKANGQRYFIDSTKITTPSIKINGSGYIPLFSGNKGSTVDHNRWRYTLGGLTVGNRKAAVSRSFINSAPSVSIGASSTYIANGSNVTLTAYASDPDGDTIYYEWSGVSSSSNVVNVSGSNQTRYFQCRVHDNYGAYSGWSNQIAVTWYQPNRAPYITITGYDTAVSEGGTVSVNLGYLDYDRDYCRISWGYYYTGSGGSLCEAVTGSMGLWTSSNLAYDTVRITPGAIVSGAYRIWVKIVDSSGAYDYATRTVTIISHTYKCGAKLFRDTVTRAAYKGGNYDVWRVHISDERRGNAKTFAFDWSNNGSGSWYIREYSWDINRKPSSCTVKPITWDYGSETIDVGGFNPYPNYVRYRITRNYIYNIRAVGNYGTIWLSENAWTYAEWS